MRESSQWNPHGQCRGRSRQCIYDVEVTDEWQAHERILRTRANSPTAPRRVERDILGADVACMCSVREQARRDRKRQPLRLVRVDYGDASSLEIGDELRLGREVIFHRPVIIKMVTGDVREHCGVERYSMHALD